jgi:hypothetical protein
LHDRLYHVTQYLQSLQSYRGSNPLKHVHGMANVLALGAITLLAGHTSHVLEPTAVLNVSVPQALQAFAGPEKPTSHAHWSLPMAATLFAGQDRQVLMLVAAKLEENLLLGQFVHSTLPVTGL